MRLTPDFRSLSCWTGTTWRIDGARQRHQRQAVHASAQVPPEFPAKGFSDLEQARSWAASFVHWYNIDHRHSGIRYVSPAQRHDGEDHALLGCAP
ncbi:MAG: transposase [Burkholderiales bacterium]|nr:transposase [Burkholderiales bacterium]